ncbi:MAG: hypothetical protein QY309_03445 [Cyclobacteriaceae bacterium]|nr:MAG: hypothetical protein QY309_03445 [Cyclobacteriaceae bacterium]
MSQFLEAFGTNLTVIAALFAIFLFFAQAFWKLIEFEKTLRDDNWQKVRDLNNHFRKASIEPRIQKLYYEVYKGGFRWGVDFLKGFIYQTNDATGENELLPNEKIKEALTELHDGLVAENTKIDDESKKFPYSIEGQSFFATLDSLYEGKRKINSRYKRMIMFCRLVGAGTLASCLLMLIGIFLQAGKMTDEKIMLIWLLISILVVVTTLVFLAVTLHAKNKLSDEWEFKQIYGNE